jgi:tRNA G18 (ribose-2'-O)-methylase SpoU
MHNVGSLFRTADALNVEKIYLCGITGTPPHREIHKTALGAEDSMDWEYFDHAEELATELQKRGYFLIGLEQVENSVSLIDWQVAEKPIVLILGNEIEGISNELLLLCDTVLEIPQFGTKHSFNVAVSGAIALWEVLRKLRFLK